MVGYTEVSVIWNGALDKEEIFPYEREDDLLAFIESVKAKAQEEGGNVEIWAVYHDHDLYEGVDDDHYEDTCIQYAGASELVWSSDADD